jgi:2-aminoadipate transaminase
LRRRRARQSGSREDIMPSFDFAPLLAPDLPPPAPAWNGFPRYNFVGGHNDAAEVPVTELTDAATRVLEREGRNLATYGLASGPLGYRRLREFLVAKLKWHAGIDCTVDEILITSGSLQGLDLVNSLLLTRGDTVLIEQETYSGSLSRLARLGVKAVGVPLDADGLRPDALASTLADLKSRGVRPKYLYLIPTVQNPTGSVMSLARREQILKLAQEHGVPIFEDECYSDLVWTGERPPAFYALAKGEGVIHIGSFSKSIAPALRVGYIVAPWPLLARMLALKTDAGSGALEQMVLAEYCEPHFAKHVPKVTKALHAKSQVMLEALAEQFGTSAEITAPAGGIYVWIKLPDVVDTQKLMQAAAAAGVTLNPGVEWCTDAARGRSRLRLCFANPDAATIRAGVATLADICRREFGVPERIANVEKARAAG